MSRTRRKQNARPHPERLSLPAAPSSRYAAPILMLTLVLSALLFAQNLNDDFLVADTQRILDSRAQGLSVFEPGQGDGFAPVSDLVLFAQSALFGFSPIGYHMIALALHLLAIWLLFHIANRLSSTFWAAIAAALFAAHPLHAGTVAWISAQPQLLTTVLTLAGCLFYLRSLVSIGWGDYGLSVLLMTAALFCVPEAWIAPAPLILLGAFYGPSPIWTNLTTRWKGLALLVFVAVATQSFRLAIQGGFGTFAALPTEASLLFENYLRNIPQALLTPINREAFAPSWVWVETALMVAGWFCLAGLVWFRNRRNLWPGLLLGMIAAYPLALSGPVGRNFETGALLYLPSAGFALFVAAILENAFEKGTRASKVLLAGLAVWAMAWVPLLAFHVSAYNQAAGQAEVLRKGVNVPFEQTDKTGPVFCERFSDSPRGVRFYAGDFSRLFLPTIGAQPDGVFFRVDENFLRRYPQAPPFRFAAKKDGFVHLVQARGEVVDRTSQTRSLLERSEKQETTSRLLLRVVDDRLTPYRDLPPRIEIEPSTVVPATSITRLCLKMDLRDDRPGSKPMYLLTWGDEHGAIEAVLDHAPSAAGFTCALMDRDPRWGAAGILTDLFITPLGLSGSIHLMEAEIVYRTTIVEIDQELNLQDEDAFWQMLDAETN